MFTANSMNCMTEVLGLGLPGNGTIPAISAARMRLAKEAGMKVMEVLKSYLRPSKILTPAAFHNALVVDNALGCVTNTVLHLPAIAHEAGVEIDLNMVNEIGANTPHLCKLAPGGHHHIEDLHAAGGLSAVMAELDQLGLLETSLPTVTGKTIKENIARATVLDHDVIRSEESLIANMVVWRSYTAI